MTIIKAKYTVARLWLLGAQRPTDSMLRPKVSKFATADRCHINGASMVHASITAKLILMSTIRGNTTWRGRMTTRRMLRLLRNNLFNRQVLVNNAENAVTNPMETSHGVAIHATSKAR